jgi:hypothetical protein
MPSRLSTSLFWFVTDGGLAHRNGKLSRLLSWLLLRQAR